MKLKIISLWQPHATLCVTPSKENPEIPAKPVETRHWPTNHLGWLGIHSAMKQDALYRHLCNHPEFRKYIEDYKKLPFGYIVGMVHISDCLKSDSQEMRDFIIEKSDNSATRVMEIHEFGNFETGRYGFTITDFVQFTSPIKAKGRQGFWYHEMPNHIGETVRLVFFGKPGIVLDYALQRGQYQWKIKLIGGGADWYTREGFKTIEELDLFATLRLSFSNTVQQ